MGKIRPMRKSTRKFGKDTYHLVGRATPINKSEAKARAERVRSKDFPARVIAVKGGFRVYARRTFFRGRKRK